MLGTPHDDKTVFSKSPDLEFHHRHHQYIHTDDDDGQRRSTDTKRFLYWFYRYLYSLSNFLSTV